MQNLQQELVELLQTEDQFVIEGQLNKTKIVEAVLRVDPGFLKLLLGSPTFKKHFFQDIEGTLVFDKIAFQRFVNNKSFLPDSYTAFKNKIGLTINDGSPDNYLSSKNDVSLVWPHKDCILEGGQSKEDAKRQEIFWNETLAPDSIDRLLSPKALSNFKVFGQKGPRTPEKIEHVQNLVLKGNNLLGLASLVATHRSRIKLIYIDPPYNTQGDANTFWYNNTFNHSTWLTFMKNRLELAKELLTDDGVLAVAIDDAEHSYLNVIGNEVFGRENHLGTIVVQNKPSGRTTDAYFATCHEYVIFFSKNEGRPEMNFFDLPQSEIDKYKEGDGNQAFKWRDFLRTGGYSTPEERPNSFYPIFYDPPSGAISLVKSTPTMVEVLPLDSEGKKRVWRKTPPSFQEHLDRDEIKVEQNSRGQWKVRIVDKIKSGVRPKTMWTDSKYDASSHGTKLLKEIFDGEKVFSYPKSIHAVKDVVKLFTSIDGNDIVLDFFGGSGTTAHALLELNKEDGGNRKFILIEQMDYARTVTSERIRRCINEDDISFTYAELMSHNERFIDEIQKASEKQDLIRVWEEMESLGSLSYIFDKQAFKERLETFKAAPMDEMKRYLVELLDKNQLYVNYSEIEDEQYGVSKEDVALNHQFYKKK